MTKEMRERLLQRGFSPEEVDHAFTILDEAKEKKPKGAMFSQTLIYWIALILTIIGNFIMALLIIPFQLILSPKFVYVAVVVLGFSFGWIFMYVLFMLSTMETKMPVIAWLFVPAIALIGVFIMMTFSNIIASLINQQSGNPLLISFTYVFAFLLPFGFQQVYLFATKK